MINYSVETRLFLAQQRELRASAVPSGFVPCDLRQQYKAVELPKLRFLLGLGELLEPVE